MKRRLKDLGKRTIDYTIKQVFDEYQKRVTPKNDDTTSKPQGSQKLQQQCQSEPHLEDVIQYPFPPGHFYSPYPNLNEVKDMETQIWDKNIISNGINLQTNRQLELLDKFNEYAVQYDFPRVKGNKYRYYYENDKYVGESVSTFCMIKHINPKRIIEVGSGFTSALLLDINECFSNDTIKLTFIEPYPDLLYSLLRQGDSQKVNIVADKLQNVDIQLFDALEENDILFIDSSHVVKPGSDVSLLFKHIFPRLNKGVYIHFHDIFYPFEYPEAWIEMGIAWNELYVLHAFLQYNSEFEVVFWNDYLTNEHREACYKVKDFEHLGSSIWLQRKKDNRPL
jgi:hypothetical protein